MRCMESRLMASTSIQSPVWPGIWFKSGRMILTLLQIAVIFAPFGVLQGVSGRCYRARRGSCEYLD